MRKFLASVILLASLVGGSVFGYWLVDKNTAAANWGKAAYTAERDWSYLDVWRYEQKQPIYIFLSNLLMGKYEEGKWCSLDDLDDKERTVFYLKDLVVVPSFKLYDMERFWEETAIMGWYMDGGIRGLLFEWDAKYKRKQEEALWKLLGKTKEELAEDDYLGYINLPHRIRNTALRKLSIYPHDAFVFLNKQQKGALALNAEHDPRPQSVKRGGELPEEYRAYFLELFKREGMGDAPLVVLEHCQSDVDSDGEDESIIILQNTEEELEFYQAARGKENYGFYTYVFYIDGERIQELYKNVLLCTGDKAIESKRSITELNYGMNYGMSILGVYDLNGDGKQECCVNIGAWELGYIAVYELNDDNEYEEVLHSSFGN